MLDPTQAIVKILFRHACAPRGSIVGSTHLADLGIDLLDLPMVILDLEDAFQVCVRYDDYAGVETVRELAACVLRTMQTSAHDARRRVAAPRKRQSWVSIKSAQQAS
jgi:acyl carrier protein